MKTVLSFIIFFASLVVNGQNEPEYREKFFPNGKLMYKGMFQNGKPVGGFERYYETGLLQARMKYSGDYVEASLYSEVGKLIATGRYYKNKKDSLWSYYNNKIVVSQDTYKEDKKEGKSFLYYSDGAIQEECTWKNDMKEGSWIRFYPDGTKMLEANYLASKLNGSFVTYSEDALKYSEGVFVNSLKDGEWRYYDKESKIELVILYSKGQPNKDMSEKNMDYLKAKEESEKKFMDPEKYMDNPDEFLMKVNDGGKKR